MHLRAKNPAANRSCLRAFLLIFILPIALHAQTWEALGPPGGDVRALTADSAHPGRLFLGTVDGHLFGSSDGGESWERLSRVSSRRDDVITAIVVDPRNANLLVASAWTQDPAAGGGIFRSEDGGRSWHPAGLAGEAVRALTQAPSDPDTLIAGTLDGLYRTRDATKSWKRISPEDHAELRNFDSVAVDRRDPKIIYAGTFHLPWKTGDGGATWKPIHEGMIDDSDVMSILVDHAEPERIYASACSGIYLSADSAMQWKKIQGIPYAARRTFVIAQDRARPANIFAATSEGLWKTSDAGMTWHRTTPATWVVNAAVVPPGLPGRVVIGTQQFGVLASDDGGQTFHQANRGFFHRQILSLAVDPENSARMVAVLADAPDPVITTRDGGKSWSPLDQGLNREPIQRVYAAPNDWWAALSRGGLLRYDEQKNSWQRAGKFAADESSPNSPSRPRTTKITKHAERNRSGRAPLLLQEVVHELAFSGRRWFAATDKGLLVSTDHGDTWNLCAIGPLQTAPVRSVRVSADGNRLWVASPQGMATSADAGKSWQWHDLPPPAGGALSLQADPEDATTLAAVASHGLYLSRDSGSSWMPAGSGLPALPVQDFVIVGRMYVASLRFGGLYASFNAGRTWDRVNGSLADGFFSALAADGASATLFAASGTDGVFAVRWSLPPAAGQNSSPAMEKDNTAH